MRALRRIKIQNLVLIEKAELDLGEHLNIFTGETGAGKSAVLSALRLISGERADISLIRKGAEMAFVEAEMSDSTIVRRELYSSGKSRCFIDDKLCSLSDFKEALNLEIVDQNSSCIGQERALLDLYCRIDLKEITQSYLEEKQMKETLSKLQKIPRDKELEWAQKELEWIETINPQKGEEEALQEEHLRLCKEEKIFSQVQSVASLFSEENALMPFRRAVVTLEKLSTTHSQFQPACESMKSALLELEEVSCFVESYFDRMDLDPKRLEWIDQRLGDLHALKKRFGPEMEEEKEKRKQLIESLNRLEEDIEQLEKSLEKKQRENTLLQEKICSLRKEKAPSFEKAILKELFELNLPYARFEVLLGSALHDVQFLFSANPNQSLLPIDKCASGGELCRLLLAMKIVLADSQSTLVFDEIDQNIGGQTASILGEKLKHLSKVRQLIYITHFVQVAKWATDHFLVKKEIHQNQALTQVKKLKNEERLMEYNRMLGK